MLIKFVKIISPYFRNKRFQLFRKLYPSNKKLRILDVGGNQEFWEPYKSELANYKITILNLTKIPVNLPNFKSVIGDARCMKRFRNNEFDIVFSNSVIEHVGEWKDQQKMVKEIRRIGRHYFVQTPNFNFPIEPHFLFPFYQFLPQVIRVFLIRHFNLGWRTKIKNFNNAIKMVNSVRLLKKKELCSLFVGATIFEEKFYGLTKSFIFYTY